MKGTIMAIIKMNETYDNRYLSDKNISLGGKGLLTFLLMSSDDFDDDTSGLCKYNDDSYYTVNKYVEELILNNYLTVVKKISNNKLIYNYVIYHNRWKMI